ADAYVRWQLLSGLPSKVDAARAAQALQVYRSAPKLRAMPGVTAADRERLDAALGSSTEGETYWADAIAGGIKQVQQANASVLAFRDELFDRLPDSADALVAGLADAYERAAAALPEAKSQLSAVTERASGWSVAATDARQIAAVADVYGKLRKEKGAEYYSSAAGNGARPKWVKRTVRLDEKLLEETEQLLRRRARDAARQAKDAKQPTKKQ
ncbi:MAG TPA: hypothetical protein VK324_03320, partial [Tepidisphaeraceae bacterium]|nr:hypothetical protein [Tepidisphaeraceae bacterium]